MEPLIANSDLSLTNAVLSYPNLISRGRSSSSFILDFFEIVIKFFVISFFGKVF